jgi:hypothetical protein
MHVDTYEAYVARFDQAVGALAVGGYGKWKGRLVRKLSRVEFDARHAEYQRLDETFRGILERGDTINDAVARLWKEKTTELILERAAP